MTVLADQPKHALPDGFYGIFIEDVNGAADGGLYAELIKNRSFEFKNPWAGWGSFGEVEIRSDDPAFKNNPHYVRLNNLLTGPEPRKWRVNPYIENTGFWSGIGVRKDERYRASFYARSDTKTQIEVNLLSPENETIARMSKPLFVEGKDWKRYEVELKPAQTQPRARFVLRVTGQGMVDFDFVSLFPADTWKSRANGWRQDLMQAIRDLKPTHLRFPGGCVVEGYDLQNRHQWKHSLGRPEERLGMPNQWGGRAADYWQSFGLGYYKYFLMAEDLGAAPMPILNCGMSCQGCLAQVAPLEEMDSYVQDALDIIEFANGSTDTQYGKIRAEMGHPEPFNLKYLGIGNENHGPAYEERLKLFQDAIKSHYPDIELVAYAGGTNNYRNKKNGIFDLKPEIRDEHFYRGSQWFFDNAGTFDSYRRDGIKLYIGEYSANAKDERKNSFRGALAEAAFMTGMERNSDLIMGAAYAPLLANISAFVWEPNLIYFNSLERVLTPNYHVQKMFAQNARGKLVSLESEQTDTQGKANLYASALINENEIIVKLINADTTPMDFEFAFPENIKLASRVEIETLHHPELEATNTFENPDNIVPVARTQTLENPVTLQGNSVNILKFKLAK